jgi:hypothetical protein
MTEKPELSALPAEGERRQSPRIDVFGQLDGYLLSVRQTAVVLDISTGGLGIALRRPLDVGSTHDLRLTTPDGETVVVRARVVNQRESQTPTGTEYFVIGIEVVDGRAALDRIIDHLTSVLSFDDL